MKYMKTRVESLGSFLAISALFCLCCLVLCGCSLLGRPGPPPSYFLLCPEAKVPASGLQGKEPPKQGKVPVIVGPVEIPAYLDRPQVVRFTGPNKLHVSQSARWAEPLDGAVERVIAANLQGLGNGALDVLPFSRNVSLGPGGQGLRILLNIYSFEQRPDGKVVLDVWWCLVPKDKIQRVAERREYLSSSLPAKTTGDMAAAMSRLLYRLSKDIFSMLVKIQ